VTGPGGGWSDGGGAWGAPPPPGGGGPGDPTPPVEGGLARIAFSPEEETHIRQTVLFMRIAAGAAVVSALLGIASSIGVGLYQSASIAGGVCAGIVVLAAQVGLGAMLVVSANALSAILTTDDRDQHHLAAALRQLRWYFLTKSILWTLGILTCCGCMALMVLLGAAALSAFGMNG
jgi:hypothetical protein